MHSSIKYPILFITIFLTNSGFSQQFFKDKTRQYKADIPTRSVMPGASLDINGDLVDDIVVIDRGNILKTIFSSGKSFGLNYNNSIKTSVLREWSLAAGDLNNDGFNEIITTGEYSQGTIITLNNISPLPKKTFTTNVYAQGSAIADINNDGWLDYFLCNEDGPPKIYINDKAGTIREKEVIRFMENDNTDGSGNYGAVWVDINGDYKSDLVLSKCKAGVTDPTDKRRINRLYINNGDGTYTESGKDFNLNSGAQTWVTAVADFDNDGDMDALVVNHYSPHQLMENIDNTHFVERPLSEILSSFSFQAITLDIDNDGLTDILLSGAGGGILLHNKSDMQFDIIKDIFDKSVVHSMSMGDYNDDGFPDIHAHLAIPVNEIGVSDDQLWLNTGNDNHYIKFSLRGSTSNRSAIGAHLTLYTPSGKQVRMIKGGESYGICNSFQQIFGLGKDTIIDSLVVRWPSGIKEVFESLSPDKTYLIQENKCITQQITLYDEPLIYKNTLLELTSPSGFASYQWNTGTKTSTLSAGPGLYHVSMTDVNGCLTISKPVRVISGCFGPNDVVIKEDSLAFCSGKSVEIIPSISASSFIWQDSIDGFSFITDKAGWIKVDAKDYCNQTISDSIFISKVSFDYQISADSIYKGQQAVLHSSSPLTKWYKSPDFDNAVYTGATYITPPLDTSTVYGARSSALLDYNTNETGEHMIPANKTYHVNSASGTMTFKVESKCIVHSLTVNTDMAGIRNIFILKEGKDTVFSRLYTLNVGVSTIILDVDLLPGNYSIATNEKVNQSGLGFKSPRLTMTSGKTSYPYTINDVLSITSSTFGPTAFLYFYDWVVYSDLLYCEGDFKTVTVQVSNSSTTSNSNEFSIRIWPNPATDILYINHTEPLDYIEVKNTSSQLTEIYNGSENHIDISNYPPGLYILSIYKNESEKHFKFIKL
ncbi:MAG TPA: FG-GAP-like repeat-containing protein [Saprospiraceae bacterium]|jgi:hypothetical protein|nr:VCBS repeat-containing protein [Saprospiraceae bacterium]HRO08962.1 FG-GAP-like repeat-containing protein [Saprospiraceae bacterium]HRP42174.1 FG-GAP-like repeat-containing protein [Saprospiraceae bacterium]